MIVKKVEFNVLNVKKILSSDGKESKVLLTLDPSNEESENVIYAPNTFLISYESIIRKQ
jgi:hypothetical protein